MAWGDITNPEAWKSAMANLLRRSDDVGQYIQEAPQKAGQAIIDAGQRQQALMDKAFDPTGKKLIRDTQAANQASMNLLEGPLGFAPAGITAWHGSPHSFDKFDITKMGTGEGAQAYGPGMYFAEAPQTAKQYQATLSNPKYKVGEKELKGNDAWAAQFLHSFEDDALPKRIDVDTAVKKAQEILKPGETQTEIVNKIKDLDKAGLSVENGYLYKVDIPDEYIPKMLDWDKPLLEQTPQVQEALAKLGIKSDKQKLKEFDDALLESLFSDTNKILPKQPTNPTGESIFQTVIQGNPKYTAEKLKEVGITGVRYKDQASRNVDVPDIDYYKKGVEKLKKLYESKPTETNKNALDSAMQKLESVKKSAKEITSNFVVFDPTDVKILEKNNQPLTRKEILEEQLNKLK